MSLQRLNSGLNIDNFSSRNEIIDYDFYDSNDSDYVNDSGCEGMDRGVKKIEISPSQNCSLHDSCTTECDEEIKCKDFVTDKKYDDNLTKCIAFENNPVINNKNIETVCKSSSEEETVTPEPGISESSTSPSSDDTQSSDLTAVTPFSSSSSSSSIKDKIDNYSDEESEASKLEMKLLQDNFGSLSVNRKNNQSPTHSIKSRVSNRPRRKNMTFTNEELRKIDRENEILLKKIMSYTKPRPKPFAVTSNTPPLRVRASAAVNRSKQQRQINYENYILLKKIHNVKSTQSFINKS